MVEPQIQEEQCGFCPGRGTLDQPYTQHRVLEASWEVDQPLNKCFVDLENPLDCVPWRLSVNGRSASVPPEQEFVRLDGGRSDLDSGLTFVAGSAHSLYGQNI